ncbi:hypothetical protein [Sulfuracidifex tepidarius]|uniref:hypothetical protein n=1 Tax=Sulfuracidifex tepidarius TaxID=1294262 RepID=UPI0011F0CF19|nr:hypothetical protein [Sulfuracidifex tepidarius]
MDRRSLIISIFLLFLYISLVPVLTSSQTATQTSSDTSFIPLNFTPVSLSVMNGNLLVASNNEVYQYQGGNLTPFLHVNNIQEIASSAQGVYVENSSGLYYYQQGVLTPLHVMAGKLFFDNFTGSLYATCGYDVYVFQGSKMVQNFSVYESFGYVTFNSKEAIVDSQNGFAIYYYNGSFHCTIDYQDALCAMTFYGNKFVAGSFDPIGVFVFNNINVLYDKVIPVIYLDQLSEYNMSLVCTNVLPQYMLVHNGLIYTGSSRGIAVINTNDSQVVYYSPSPAYSMVEYHGKVYVATNGGIMVLNVKPLPIFYVTLVREGGPQSVFFTVNGSMKEMSFSCTIPLEEGVYNFTFFNDTDYHAENSTMIVRVDYNTTFTVNYVGVPEVLYINLPQGVKGDVYVNGTEYQADGPTKIILPYGVYDLKVEAGGEAFKYTVFLTDYTVITPNVHITSSVNVNTSSTSGVPSTQTVSSVTSSNSFTFIAIVAVFVVALVMILLIYRASRK